MRAVVLQHEVHEDAALLGPALEQAGFSLVKRFRSVHREDLQAELVVVMGGSMSLSQSDQHPFLSEELGLLLQRLAQDRPCLGICLGAQLLAAAAGAEVFPGKNGLEVGAAPVRWSREGLEDPVVRGVHPKTVVAHWHQDTFQAVPGATLLASSDRYTQQAFRLGNSYGFQFHPELNAQKLGEWLEQEAEELATHHKALDRLRAQLGKLKAAEGELGELLARLAHHFARTVG
jgi:GMP synthase (glutamine-hydrolysing)